MEATEKAAIVSQAQLSAKAGNHSYTHQYPLGQALYQVP